MKKLTTLLAAFLFTAGMAFAQNNSANLDQLGNNNESVIEQVAQGNSIAEVKQDGNSNENDLRQASYSGSSFHTATVKQVGDRNDANLLSQGGVGSNDLRLDQIGNDNETTVAHFNGSHLNDILQRGDLNNAEIAHRASFDNDVIITQRGNRNMAKVEDEGQGANGLKESFVDINQNGNRNQSTVSFVGVNNTLTISQINGNLNEATIQTDLDILVDDNVADILQNGFSNVATTTQNTSGNVSNVRQIGNGNTSTVAQ